MQQYLILQLSGPMQAWGLPTFEGGRPSAPFPGRSGLLGLLGACLGIRRNDLPALQALADSVRFAVRCDAHETYPVVNLTDFHTIKDAREKAGGLKMHDTIITRREYLYDARFTVAIWGQQGSEYSLAQLAEVVKKPIYTPYLGRRSCPLSHPLFKALLSADSAVSALQAASPVAGAIYSEESITGYEQRLSVRDEPLIHLPRQFARRHWFVIQGGTHVSE